MKKAILFFLCTLVACISMGCSEKTALENGKVNVIVSRDFGNEKLSDEEIDFSKDTSVMEVMEENFDVETAYGGGFINAIDGLKSGFTDAKDKKKIDWFYYVNGLLAEVGADETILNENDIVIWDYHDWDNNIFNSSIIGCYPVNFTHGDDGNALKTEILCEKSYEKESKELLVFLERKGLKGIDFKNLDEKQLANGQINSILIGKWNEILKFNTIKEIYENGEKAGLFFQIENDIKALNENGEICKEYKKGAVITSFVKEYGLTGTTWMITGNDEECIKKAVKLLYENPEKIKGKFSVIVTNDEIINIPIKN